jgi:hypothetical protein
MQKSHQDDGTNSGVRSVTVFVSFRSTQFGTRKFYATQFVVGCRYPSVLRWLENDDER